MPYYAVQNGRQTGVFSTWDECREQVNGWSGAKFKKFHTHAEALAFANGSGDAYRPAPYSTSLSLAKAFKMVKNNEYQNQTTSGRQNNEYLNQTTSGRKHTSIYTDGCCTNNGRRGARGGIGVYFGDNDPRNISAPLTGRQTNNRAEIEACSAALETARRSGIQDVEIITDSHFMIDGITKYVPKWKKNGWKLTDGGAVKNREEFERLDSLQQGLNVKWTHVRGHRGIHGNEMADTLARHGANQSGAK